MPLIPLIALLVVGSLLARRANEMFLLSIRQGQVDVVRGRVPAALLEAISDVARDTRLEHATLRGIRGPTGARLVVHGADDRVAQQLRNVFGVHRTRN